MRTFLLLGLAILTCSWVGGTAAQGILTTVASNGGVVPSLQLPVRELVGLGNVSLPIVVNIGLLLGALYVVFHAGGVFKEWKAGVNKAMEFSASVKELTEQVTRLTNRVAENELFRLELETRLGLNRRPLIDPGAVIPSATKTPTTSSSDAASPPSTDTSSTSEKVS